MFAGHALVTPEAEILAGAAPLLGRVVEDFVGLLAVALTAYPEVACRPIWLVESPPLRIDFASRSPEASQLPPRRGVTKWGAHTQARVIASENSEGFWRQFHGLCRRHL